MASGSLVEVWVWLLRFSSRKWTSSFRPPLAAGSTGAPPRPEALHSGQGFHQLRAAVPVLGERRVIPDRTVDAKLDEPAIQQVELQPFHQLAFRADCVERLAAVSPAEFVRRDRGPSQRRVHRRKVETQV